MLSLRTIKLLPAVFFCAASSTLAQEPTDTISLRQPLIPVSSYFTLENGLKVVLSEDHDLPVATVLLVYNVGARDENVGEAGFAHFFEHMMFEGSKNVGKMAHFNYIQGVGGTLNASTRPDFTTYYNKVPSNQIELALWLESDRMKWLNITQANFVNQLKAVTEEKRQSIDNQPYKMAAIRLHKLMFANRRNQQPVIGQLSDLERANIQDIKRFYNTYYTPNNATIAIVGDFDARKIRRVIEKYFSSIQRRSVPAIPDVSEPSQTASKHEVIADSRVELPAFWIGWKTPGRRDRDAAALTVLDRLLTAGNSSRLVSRMIKTDHTAISVESFFAERRGPGAFEIFVMCSSNTSAEKVRESLWNEIERLQSQPVGLHELEKARNQVLRRYFSSSSFASLQRCFGRAQYLAENAMFFDDPTIVNQDMAAILAVTADDILRVAQSYLRRDGSTVVDISPGGLK